MVSVGAVVKAAVPLFTGLWAVDPGGWVCMRGVIAAGGTYHRDRPVPFAETR